MFFQEVDTLNSNWNAKILYNKIEIDHLSIFFYIKLTEKSFVSETLELFEKKPEILKVRY